MEADENGSVPLYVGGWGERERKEEIERKKKKKKKRKRMCV